ncbi:MAG: Phosphoribosylglycinamide formyltransferase [Candidatus Carbobacillus altaicus]|uniref:Phosphoribosylglycinamide formyltransferase n=1 Tax=Candidatus Carbonibacillus altaicus TaxID=2163959 RepID=A0A2R6XYL5_9BACL|nr:MAG: Phosphoribosylglycinamide formyltransferase [Candidatus Carbobacillus altaicus]
MSEQDVKKIAVFASGTGTNYTALKAYEGPGRYQIALLVSDRPGAPVTVRAANDGVSVFAEEIRGRGDRGRFEARILEHLKDARIDLIVLAGYMRLIGETLLSVYPERIVNIHPSLLPAFPGREAIAQALAYGVKVTGATVHLVDAGLDSGPIIAQQAVEVTEDETLETLTTRIHSVEHALYPQTVARLLHTPYRVRGRRFEWV